MLPIEWQLHATVAQNMLEHYEQNEHNCKLKMLINGENSYATHT
jgi:hypothetical protein